VYEKPYRKMFTEKCIREASVIVRNRILLLLLLYKQLAHNIYKRQLTCGEEQHHSTKAFTRMTKREDETRRKDPRQKAFRRTTKCEERRAIGGT
jgi:hypothetical protein